jgi:hypothetical protein
MGLLDPLVEFSVRGEAVGLSQSLLNAGKHLGRE